MAVKAGQFIQRWGNSDMTQQKGVENTSSSNRKFLKNENSQQVTDDI